MKKFAGEDSIKEHVFAAIGKAYGPPDAAARLARIRRGAGRGAYSAQSAWDLELLGAKEEILGDPSAEEAIHAVLTTYALHQQSNEPCMCKTGAEHALCAVVAAQDVAASGSDNMNRHLRAMMAAGTGEAISFHLRQVASTLRAARRPIDYPRLAWQLARAWRGGKHLDNVRREWAREYNWGRTHLATTDADPAVNHGETE